MSGTEIEMSAKAPAAPANAAAAPASAAAGHSHSHKVAVSPFAFWLFLFQVVLIILFGTCTTFADSIRSTVPGSNPIGDMSALQLMGYVGTTAMIFLGFGMLYLGVTGFSWNGISQNFIICALALQWAVLLNGFWENVSARVHHQDSFGPIPLALGSFIRSSYSAATVLVSLGAVLGRISYAQTLVLLVVEIVISCANETIAVHELRVTDPGGSMLIHTFGAACGLAFSWVLGDKERAAPKTSRHSATFAIVGTLFLFIFWPFFNVGMLSGSAAHRGAINTALCIACSCVGAFMASHMLRGGARLDMEDIQNATLAGGVAMGAACDMLSGSPWGAMLTGLVSGAVSTAGFVYLLPRAKAAGLTDTCGIMNLHLIPGLIGGVASAIAAAGVAVGTSRDAWSQAAMDLQFPGRKAGRSALAQGGFQMAVVVISLLLGIAAGALAGWLAKLPAFSPKAEAMYSDEQDWHVPEEEWAGQLAAREAALELRLRGFIKEQLAGGAAPAAAAPAAADRRRTVSDAASVAAAPAPAAAV